MEKEKRPEKLTIRPCNDIGLIIESACRLPEIKFYVENGSVLFWATTTDFKGQEIETMQYLNPRAAMIFAKAMEACAIQALKEDI